MSDNNKPRMQTLAEKWLEEYFSDGVARRPGDMEDDFTGQWSLALENWRTTPFFKALGTLVDEGKIHFGRDEKGVVWYATPGNLPCQRFEE